MMKRALCLFLAVVSFLPSIVLSEGSISDFVASYRSRGRFIQDLVVDPSGNVHVAWTAVGSKVHETGTLFYARLDRGGRSAAETQITKYGGIEDVRIDVDSKNQAVVLYSQLKRLCIALFDQSGAMQTEMDRMLTPEETDARFEFSRDDADNLCLFGRGAIDYFWAIDQLGNTLQERRGRWVRQATPGFLFYTVNPKTLLLVWASRTGPVASIQTLKFDLATFSHGEIRSFDLKKIAEAIGEDVAFSGASFVRSGKDILYFTSLSDSGTAGRMYRVRFNVRGDPVRRWATKKLYHLQAGSPKEAGCQFRVANPSKGRSERKSLELVGLGRDGNIYHLKGNLPALSIY